MKGHGGIFKPFYYLTIAFALGLILLTAGPADPVYAGSRHIYFKTKIPGNTLDIEVGKKKTILVADKYAFDWGYETKEPGNEDNRYSKTKFGSWKSKGVESWCALVIPGKKVGRFKLRVDLCDSNWKVKDSTQYITININPKHTALSNAFYDAGSSRMKVVWEKGKGADGYQVQIALNKKFTSGVSKQTVSGTSAIFNVSRGRTYYMRVRTYKKVGKNTLYSSWSAVKKRTAVTR